MSGDFAGWLSNVAELLRMVAYLYVILSLFPLFGSSGCELTFWRRGLSVVCLLLLAVMQLGVVALQALGRAEWVIAARLAVSVVLVVAVVGLRPLLRYLSADEMRHDDRLSRRIAVVRAAAAAESQAGLDLAERTANIGHWRMHLRGDEVIWSEGVYRIVGRLKSQFVADRFNALEVFHNDDRAAVRRAIRRAIVCSEGFDIGCRVVRPRGEIRCVRLRGVAQSAGGGRVSAIIGILSDETERWESEAALRGAMAAAEEENAKLLELAMLDSLTSLPNRRRFDAVWEVEFRRAAREMLPIAVVMVDIDYFKSYNDFYGHVAGDECLRRVAAAVAGVPQRPADLTARCGGEEFVVLLPNTGAAGAEALARLMVDAVRRLALPHVGNPDGVVTISCGVAALEPHQLPAVPVAVLEQADAALYEAKSAGRNRVVLA